MGPGSVGGAAGNVYRSGAPATTASGPTQVSSTEVHRRVACSAQLGLTKVGPYGTRARLSKGSLPWRQDKGTWGNLRGGWHVFETWRSKQFRHSTKVAPTDDRRFGRLPVSG